MISRLSGWALGIALATALCIATVALAQQPGGAQQGGRGGWGTGRGGDWGGFPQRMGDMSGFMNRMQPASICVGGDYVYVVRGNTLYQFEVKGLKLVKKTQLEEDVPVPRPVAPPAGGGDRPAPPPPQ